MRACDLRTIAAEPISSQALMERASERWTKAFLRDFTPRHVLVLCGPGNNGGDGLVIARLLHQRSIPVDVYLAESERYSEDNSIQQVALIQSGLPLHTLGKAFNVTADTIVIDALFGSGLDRPLGSEWVEIIKTVNALNVKIVAVDMPSGMPDRPIFEWSSDSCIQADKVYTFQYPKLSLLLPCAAGFAKSFEVLDIGLLPFQGQAEAYMTEEKDLALEYLMMDKFDHKYKKGHCLIAGGSKGKTGAVVLSAEAAFRTSAGLVTACIPEVALPALQSYLPEAMYTLCGKDRIENFEIDLNRVSAVGIGPGLGSVDHEVFAEMLVSDVPLVIDADGLRMLASCGFEGLPQGTVLTPHEGELKALVGEWSGELDKIAKVKRFCLDHQVVLVVKGAHTLVTDGRRVLFNPIGHPAMATAGSGDVLLGALVAMRAKGMPPLEAAQCAVYIHAKAALDYLGTHSSANLLAGDIAKHLAVVLKELLAN